MVSYPMSVRVHFITAFFIFLVLITVVVFSADHDIRDNIFVWNAIAALCERILYMMIFFLYMIMNSLSLYDDTFSLYDDIFPLYDDITNLVCYAYFHWLFNPECQHIFGKQTGYICTFSVSLIWAPKNNNNVVDRNRNIYASLNQYHNTE